MDSPLIQPKSNSNSPLESPLVQPSCISNTQGPNGDFTTPAHKFPLMVVREENSSPKKGTFSLANEGASRQRAGRNFDGRVGDIVLAFDDPRYTNAPFFSEGVGGVSFASTPFCGDLVVRVSEVDEKGSDEDGEVGPCVNPLRIVMADGYEALIGEEDQLELGHEEGRKETNEEGVPWSSTSEERRILKDG